MHLQKTKHIGYFLFFFAFIKKQPVQLRSRFLVFYTRLNYVTDIKLFWVHVLWWRDVLVFTCWIAEGRCYKVNAVSPVGCLKFLCSIVLWNIHWKNLRPCYFSIVQKTAWKWSIEKQSHLPTCMAITSNWQMRATSIFVHETHLNIHTALSHDISHLRIVSPPLWPL